MRSDGGAHHAEAVDMFSDAESGKTPALPKSSEARIQAFAWGPGDEILVMLKNQQASLNDRLRGGCRAKPQSPIDNSAETAGANFRNDWLGQRITLKLTRWGPGDEILVNLTTHRLSLNDRLARRGRAKPQSPIDMLGSLSRSNQLSALRSSGDTNRLNRFDRI